MITQRGFTLSGTRHSRHGICLPSVLVQVFAPSAGRTIARGAEHEANAQAAMASAAGEKMFMTSLGIILQACAEASQRIANRATM
jgi:hypothetical protein